MQARCKSSGIVAVVVVGMLAAGSGLIAAAPESPQKETKGPQAASGPAIPLKLGHSIPVAVQSAGVQWRGNTYHLVGLTSMQFELDKRTNRLKADVHAAVTGFDDVDYDVSVAVFDTDGKLLGVARTVCGVARMWAGKVGVGLQTLNLDFGVSLDYSRAAAFMVSISNRKVLTPDQWQK
jgi:hypothetical protein